MTENTKRNRMQSAEMIAERDETNFPSTSTAHKCRYESDSSSVSLSLARRKYKLKKKILLLVIISHREEQR